MRSPREGGNELSDGATGSEVAATEPAADGRRLSRRKLLTYVTAAPLLTVAARLVPGAQPSAEALEVPMLEGLVRGVTDAVEGTITTTAIPSLPSVEELFDLGDALELVSLPTMPLVELVVGSDGRVVLDLPRLEKGQGISTALAMMIADELDIRLENVEVTLAEGRPELLLNQFTGGSSTIRVFDQPLRLLAAKARFRLLRAASSEWDVAVGDLRTREGQVIAPDGRRRTYGALSSRAASLRPIEAEADVPPKEAGDRRIVGTPQRRIDALDIVTGRKKFTLDLDVPDALPTIVRKPPSVVGRLRAVHNTAEVERMPGVVGVVPLANGVAVAAETFEHARAGAAALDVDFDPGPLAGHDNERMFSRLRAAMPPFVVPPTDSLLGATLEAEYTWAPLYNASLETETAIADARPDGVEIWSGFQGPIFPKQKIAAEFGLPVDKVRTYVVPAGGAFGRRMHVDGPLEAARISRALGRPVKLMWPRIDDVRHGRIRPPEVTRFRANLLGDKVASFEQRVSAAEGDYRHGLGEILTATVTELPERERLALGNLAFGAVVFTVMVSSPYNFGAYTKLKGELPMGSGWTGAYRSVPIQPARAAEESMVDEIADHLGKDPVAFRNEVLRSSRAKAVLNEAARSGGWGRRLPRGVGQGVAAHRESRAFVGAFVEVDARDPKNPMVTRARIAIDVGRVINPLGLKAQMEGCLVDSISVMLRAGLHYQDGLPLESSYADYHFARLRDVPEDTEIILMPDNGAPIGGAGEVGFAAVSGAIANAYARATGERVRNFPIVQDIDFDPVPPGVLPPPVFR